MEIKRIKKADRANNHKILLHLSVKKDQFVCEVKQAIENGICVHYNSEKLKAFIKSFCPEFEEVISLSGKTLEGRSIHDVANSIYFTKETLKTVTKELTEGPIYTADEHNEKLNVLWGEIVGHKIFTRSEWSLLWDGLRKYHNKQGDLYKYKNFQNSADHWISQGEKAMGTIFTKYLKPLIVDYFDKLGEYRCLENKYKYKTLPRKSEIWTIDHLASHLSITVDQARCLLLSPDLDSKVEVIVLENAERSKIKLANIVEQYKLTSVA